MGIQNISGRIIIFILLLGASTITYFIANKDRYVPNDKLYVEYTKQQLLDMQLDYQLIDLNRHTLDEVFGQGNLLDASQLVTNGDFSDGITGWTPSVSTISNVSNNLIITGDGSNFAPRVSNNLVYVNGIKYYTILRFRTLATDTLSIRLNLNSLIPIQYSPVQNQWYLYSNVFDNTSTNPYKIYHYYTDAVTSNGKTIEIDYSYHFNISTLIANKQYSPLYSTTFDLMSDAQIKAQMDAWVQNPQYWLEYDQLGIYLTQAEMEEYYQMYLEVLDGERVFDLALGTIDSNGRDYYYLSVSDYEDLGNNGVVDFKYLFSENGPLLSVSKTLKVVKNFIETGIESFGNFIDGYVSLMQKIKDFLIWWQ
ncbi:MAG: hypothetical protein PHY08_13270 [Candidatus Cloacimonetes bacterium]|nr:hypothetical protein [Candidatus Cloacimonadota bacterium]